jgi:hypothetical protein
MMIHPHDPSPAWGASIARPTGSVEADETGTIDGAYRLLMVRGLSSVEAGNVVAYITGLHAAEGGWTVKEIKHLVAIRLLVVGGVIAS